jgi:hypothetical protein
MKTFKRSIAFFAFLSSIAASTIALAQNALPPPPAGFLSAPPPMGPGFRRCGSSGTEMLMYKLLTATGLSRSRAFPGSPRPRLQLLLMARRLRGRLPNLPVRRAGCQTAIIARRTPTGSASSRAPVAQPAAGRRALMTHKAFVRSTAPPAPMEACPAPSSAGLAKRQARLAQRVMAQPGRFPQTVAASSSTKAAGGFSNDHRQRQRHDDAVVRVNK